MTSSDLLAKLIELRDLLTLFCDKIGAHKKIIDARNYIKNNLIELTAYKSAIEAEIKAQFQNDEKLVLDNILPIIEYFDQYERSYEKKPYRNSGCLK